MNINRIIIMVSNFRVTLFREGGVMVEQSIGTGLGKTWVIADEDTIDHDVLDVIGNVQLAFIGHNTLSCVA